MRFILLTHRYLAVATGLLMTLWCLSGFVMMYQAMPELSNQERLDGLQTLVLDDCCELGDFAPHDATPLDNFRIEMLSGEPVLRISAGADTQVISLTSGQPLTPLSEPAIAQIAGLFARGNTIHGSPVVHGVIEMDQWTVQSARRNQPVWHVSFDDAAGTDIYINGRTGEVFQQTNRRERVLARLGAIPHWLYPTILRQNGALWTTVVIWTSILGTFLAATGLSVGITRLGRNRKRKALASPFEGWWYWHHVSGLVFGVLLLTWVFSGLMTMNPWGALSGSDGGDYRSGLTGSVQWSDLRQFLSALDAGQAQLPTADEVVQITPAVFQHQLYLMAITRSGEQYRLDHLGQSAPLNTEAIEQAVANLDAPVIASTLMFDEDQYYYGHKREVDLPVFRVIVDDAEHTRLYINTETGAVRVIGSNGRWSRWIRTGLHDLDFPVLRIRPVWDIVVILLLTGVTLVCATGTWMALRRIRRDFRSVRRRLLPSRTHKFIPQ